MENLATTEDACNSHATVNDAVDHAAAIAIEYVRR